MHNSINLRSKAQKHEPLASMIKRLGAPGSTTLLHSGYHVFRIPEVDGAIGYYKIGNCAIAIGDPICLPQDIAELTKSFHLYCSTQNLKPVYLLTYRDFADWAIRNGFHTLIQVGSELSVDPTDFHKKQKLRWKMNQAIQNGVHIEEYKNFDLSIENQIKNTIEIWLKERQGPQIHLGGINFFDSDAEKRIFYAKQNDKMIGVLILTPIDRFQGWVVSSYLAVKDAPIGTTEFLICSTINVLAGEKCHFLCLGAVSANQLGEVIGLNPFIKTLAGLIFKLARWFFKLDKKAVYLNKYHPYLRSIFVLSKEKITLPELFAIKHALNVKLW